MSSGSSVVVVVVDIFGEDYALLLTYALCNGYQQQNTASMLLLHIVVLPRNFFMSMGTVVLWPFFMFHWLVLKLLGEMNRVISVPLHWFYLMNILFFCLCVCRTVLLWKGEKKFCQASTFNSDYMTHTHCGKIQLASDFFFTRVKSIIKLSCFKIWIFRNFCQKLSCAIVCMLDMYARKYWDVAYVIECLGLHGGASPAQSSCIKSITIKQLLRAVFENASQLQDSGIEHVWTMQLHVQIET